MMLSRHEHEINFLLNSLQVIEVKHIFLLDFFLISFPYLMLMDCLLLLFFPARFNFL